VKSSGCKEISASAVTLNWGMGDGVSKTDQKLLWLLGKKKSVVPVTINRHCPATVDITEG